MVKSRRADIEAWNVAMEATTFSPRQTPDEAASPPVHTGGSQRTRYPISTRLMMAMYPVSRKGKALSRRRVLPSLQPLPEETDAGQEAKNRATAFEDTALASEFGLLRVSDASKEREGGLRSCKLPPRPRTCKSKQSLKRRLCCPLRRLRDQYVSCLRDIDGMGDFTGAVSGPHAVNYAQEARNPTYID